MTRKSAPTTMLDECTFDPSCPFECPLSTCVKEYPGGVGSYLKDVEFLGLIRAGMDMYEAAVKTGINPKQAGRRYEHATSFAGYTPQKVSKHRTDQGSHQLTT